jgi:hypothetical protein
MQLIGKKTKLLKERGNYELATSKAPLHISYKQQMIKEPLMEQLEFLVTELSWP